MKTRSAFPWALILFFLPAVVPARAADPAPSPAVVTLVDLRQADAPTRLTLTCLQGIVNRGAERPLLYCIQSDPDRVWFDQVYALRGFKGEAKTPSEALAQWGARAKGQILYDPAQPESVNLATTLAGLEDALPAVKPAEGNTPVVKDLRGLVKTRKEAFQWAIDNLLPRCSRRKLAILAPEQMELRDYLVAEKVLVLDPDLKQADDAAAFRSVVGHLGEGATLYWGGRAPAPAETRALFARDARDTVPGFARSEGLLLVPGADVANLSFHSRVPGFAVLRQVKRLVQHTPKITYVTFLFSGDGNLDYAFGRMRTLWDDPARGMGPLGWELPAAMAELAPALFSAYYAEARWAGTDQFLMAPSGAGYVLPSGAKPLASFLAATEKCARDTGLTAAEAIDLSTTEAERPWPQYSQQPALSGLIASGSAQAPTRVSGRPLIGETVRLTKPEGALAAITAAAAKQIFVLVVVDGNAVTPTQVAQIASRLPRDYSVVCPYDFLDLLAERDIIDHFEMRNVEPLKLQQVTFNPAKPGADTPIAVGATLTGDPIDVRIVYNVGNSPDLSEPMAFDSGAYQGSIPPVLRGADVKFRVRVTDALLRTTWSAPCSLRIAAPDTDGDGLSDPEEKLYGTDSTKKDTDGDGLLDGNDPAPLSPATPPAGWQGPLIGAVATAPRTPPAAGKPGSIQALVFDPTGVQSVSVALSADGRSLPGGEMKEIRQSQVFQRALPALTAGQTLTVVVTATNGAGKTSEQKITLPVTTGVRITQPGENYAARKPTLVRIETFGKTAWVRVLVNGFQQAKLTHEPYLYQWDPRDFYPGTHEIVAEAYDANGNLLDFDILHMKVLPDRPMRR